ncbi:MAG: radical SAM protein [Acidobacteriia bacterium]|nr:radical SAM protein [Terriglobia bacterium]
MTGKPCCYRPPAEVIEARGRLLCDTQRGFERVRDLLEAGGEAWDTARIARWLSERERGHVETVPEEIEIELTTEDPLSDGSLLRPRGAEVGARGPVDMAVIRSMAAAIEPYDDVRVVLAGFGEPCCHPQFAEICRILRGSSAAAIAVRTSAVLDDPAIEAALFDTPVDVVEVTLDAVTRETYRRVHGADRFDEVVARLDRWLDQRTRRRSVLPLVIPSFIKANETLHEMEEFLDRWQRRLGMALITGYSHCAGQRERRAVTSMAPPQRGICRRVFRRAMVLADGRLTTCDEDFAARQVVGAVGEMPFSSLWQAPRFVEIRSHPRPDQPLCPACDEWHRP